jgi:hypothetical protein
MILVDFDATFISAEYYSYNQSHVQSSLLLNDKLKMRFYVEHNILLTLSIRILMLHRNIQENPNQI